MYYKRGKRRGEFIKEFIKSNFINIKNNNNKYYFY